MHLFNALEASAIHRAQKHMPGGDTGNRYTVVVGLLTSIEATHMSGQPYDDDDYYYTLAFSGDVPSRIRAVYGGYAEDDRLSPEAQAILRAAMQRVAKAPIGYSGLRQSLFDWGIGIEDGWTPL